MAARLSKTPVHILVPRPYPRKLSLVMPMYNEEALIPILRRELERFLGELQCEVELILVNDGSSDSTLPQIVEWARENRSIRVIDLSRNFGHQIAATAGLDCATGDAIVLMDADLQDPLAVIHEMIDRYCAGYDVVYGQRARRDGESRFKLFTAWAFYRVMRMLTDTQLPVDTGDFRLMSRECLDGLILMRETHRFLRGMVAWLGHSQIAVRYHRHERAAGETKYPLRKMLFLAWTAATSFSTVPLKVSFALGIFFGLFGVEEAVRALLATILHWYTVPGWASLMIVTSILGSALLTSISVLGEYVGKVYEQGKGRPLYLIARRFGAERSENGEGMRAARDGDYSYPQPGRVGFN